MRKLNLGCGSDYKKGWVNVDFDKNVKADAYFDLGKHFPLKKSGFDYILLQDVLEHFTKEGAKALLEKCREVLSAEGRMEVRVPNLIQIIKQFKKDPGVMIEFIYGHFSGNDKLDSHKFGYTVDSLKKVLESVGFTPVSIKTETTNIVCVARKTDIKIYPIKVLISGQDSGGLGGAEKFTGDLAKSLIEKKVKVFFTAYAKSLFTKKLKRMGFKVWEIPVRMDIIGDIKGLIKFFLFFPLILSKDINILFQFRKQGGNVVILTGISDKIILSPIAKLFSLTVVWIEFAPLSEVFKKNYYIPKILYRLVKNIPNLVIVPTQNTKKHLIPETRISESKIRVIPCGIKMLDVRSKMSDVRNKKTKIIGMVSRIQKGKGQDLLIKAASKLKFRDFKVVIIGGGETQKLKMLAEKLGVASKVKFLGYVERVENELRNFDVFVFPSTWGLEGFGLVLAEAMNAGVPVVAADFGPIPEVVGNAACLVGPTPKAIACGIEKVLSDRKYAKNLIQEGFAQVKKYDINVVADKYYELLADCSK